jgi:hypothetical protein
MTTGSHASYQWLVSKHGLDDVLRFCRRSCLASISVPCMQSPRPNTEEPPPRREK